MHKLDRNSVPAPTCLAAWDYQTQNWDDFTSNGAVCKRELRLALQRLQGGQYIADAADDTAYYIHGLRCAYCEGTIYYGGHIEHFRRKNPAHFPELTFAWSNLFLACGSQEHCGHYKDRGGSPYNAAELIKPDEHDPDDYLYFHSSGSVCVRNTRPGMTDADRRRASETIRVFHLDCGPLQGARRHALQLYRDRNTGILELLMAWDAADREEYIRMEIEATRWEPYSAVIKHYFEKVA